MELKLQKDMGISKIGEYYESIRDSLISTKEYIVDASELDTFDTSTIQFLLMLKEESLKSDKTLKFFPPIKEDVIAFLEEVGIRSHIFDTNN